jgi:hypothetical protein
MYPILIASGRSLLSDTEKPYKTIFTLAIIWLALCIYKYGLEMHTRSSGEEFLCTGSASECAVAKPLYLWYISLALMGAVVNSIIAYLSYCLFKKSTITSA